MEIIIKKTGEMRFVDNPHLAGLKKHGISHTARASQVLPRNKALKHAFLFLRRVFGETGRVSEWTRRWKCLWMVDLALSHGPVFGPFKNRQEAIDAEIEWLVNNGVPVRSSKTNDLLHVHKPRHGFRSKWG